MLETVHSVAVLLTPTYHNRLLVMSLSGGDSSDVLIGDNGAMVVAPGVAVTGIHCIETGEDLVIDDDYAIFHTGMPDAFMQAFVPAIRTAVAQIGWPKVRVALRNYLSAKD